MEKYRRVLALLTLRQANFLDNMSKEGYSKVEILRRALDLFIVQQQKTIEQEKKLSNTDY